jgi:regulation of enolase protein 1 (concanavalin A-like superfamily)
MCRKLIYISFVLLVSLVGISAAQDTDPTLVGWWKLDETSGIIAADSSGMGNNGTLWNSPEWVTGKVGGALQFDGEDDYVDLPIGSLISSLKNCTFATWVNWTGGDPWHRIFDFGSGESSYMFLTPSNGNTNTARFSMTVFGNWDEDQINAPEALPTGWHHVAVTIDEAKRIHTMYLDGAFVAANTAIRYTPSSLGTTTQNWLGRSQFAADVYYSGSLDDFRIYDRVLTINEVDELVPRFNATKPVPTDGAVITTTAVTLTWAAGHTANSHHLYVGENLEDATNGTGGTDKGTTSANTYQLSNLETGKTYYWRVDEVEADGVTVHIGPVWSFTVSGKIASNPVPANGTRFVAPTVTLTWTAGAGATQHHVYLGSNPQNVQNGTGDTDKGTVETAVFVPATLETGKTYYWRVDEFDGQDTYTGEIWCFRTMPETPITNPNLVGWWKLDEGEGTMALDWSGNSNHGTILGGAEWVEGYDGGALGFDGQDDYVDLPIGSIISSLTDSTFAIWANFVNIGGNWVRLWDFGTGTSVNMFLTPCMSTAGNMRFAITDSNLYNENQTTATATLPTGWHHVTVTIDPGKTTHTLYLDGQVAAENTNAGNTPSSLGNTTRNWLGRSQYSGDNYYSGSLDDFRIYNYVMTEAEILEIMKADPLPAQYPKPANRALTDVEKASLLSWSPGEKAAQHDVYLGTNALTVEGADTSDTTGIYRGRQDPNTYTPTETLEPGQIYYWRIDEVNTDGTISVGRVWIFTVAEYLILDDFEDYDDVDNRIYYTWGDYFVNNSGMTVGHLDPPFAEQEIVHSGSQAMYMRYDNDGTVNEGTNYEQSGTLFYSEAEREWLQPQDWTRKGVNSLTLWFRGLPGSLGSFTLGPPITMTAIGTDISGTADQLHFAYKRLAGNGSITAKVLSVSNTDSLAKAGVMIRQTLEPGSVHAAIIVSPANRAMFLRRINTDETTSSTSRPGVSVPRWVRLTRSGNTFTAQHSANGTSWTTVGSPVEITMLSDAYVGLCLTSRNANAVCTAEFSDIDISPAGSAAGDWQSQDIGLEVNAPEQLYVALQDSAGNSAVVNHPDSAAAIIDTWTQWSIPLTGFTGVNLQAVMKISIGVGNRANPQAGGAGDLYIDDIGLYLP